MRSPFSTWLLVAGLLATPMCARAQTFDVQGGCRDGLAHGAWELRDDTGKLRVLGAFNRGRRAGSFIYWDASGVRIAHLAYEEDARSGTNALWRPAGNGLDAQQRLEASYAAGRLNGAVRTWDAEGQLRGEYRYAAGTLVEARAWTARGRELAPALARAQAEADAAANDAYQGDLEKLVARHAGFCKALPPPAKEPR